jgi:Rad3-related DNA helicase
VLGGLFSEGVDLPGEQLIGALIVGVGLPTPSLRLKTLQGYYEERFGDGFLYAWMIPAMQKVAQAAGRVIRTESDRGLVLLMDDRYYDPRYVRLLPAEWQWRNENVPAAVRALESLEET